MNAMRSECRSTMPGVNAWRSPADSFDALEVAPGRGAGSGEGHLVERRGAVDEHVGAAESLQCRLAGRDSAASAVQILGCPGARVGQPAYLHRAEHGGQPPFVAALDPAEAHKAAAEAVAKLVEAASS
jgi:hypothetical protein